MSAEYQIGPEKHYRLGRMYQEGEKLITEDDELPSHTFIPLNEEARKAYKKAWPKRKMPVPASVAEAAPVAVNTTGTKDVTPA